MIPRRFLIITSAVLCLAQACTLFSIEEEDRFVKNEQAVTVKPNTSIIKGTVVSDYFINKPIAIVALRKDAANGESRSNVEHIIRYSSGPFMMYVPHGEYLLFVLMDKNEDNIFDRSEVVADYRKLSLITLNENDVLSGITLRLESDYSPPVPLLADIRIENRFETVAQSAVNGQVVKIYDSIFSPGNAKVGLWSPSNFIRSFGANIYLLEPYDPSKVPILFVHGSQGSPQDWAYFLFRLDRKRYQPWFYYYPTGIRITLAIKILHADLIELHEKYPFGRLCITAHSMGGLVTRGLLTSYDFSGKNAFIKQFITLATPWTGFVSADTAVYTSPVKLPNWIDMASRSMFIKKLLEKPLPESIDYHLFFGKEESVSGGKAIDERVFRGADGNYAFDVDHTTILSDRQVFFTYSEILDRKFYPKESGK